MKEGKRTEKRERIRKEKRSVAGYTNIYASKQLTEVIYIGYRIDENSVEKVQRRKKYCMRMLKVASFSVRGKLFL